jgi:carboxymethylenebutenolidase
MKRLLLVCLALIVLVSPALAAEQTVSFKSGDETANGFLVTPDGKGPFPAVLVIHEWWGLDDWVKDQARALARDGYVALAANLYRGKVTNKLEEAHQLMMGTPRDRALRDLKAAFNTLAGRPDVRKRRDRRDRLVHGRHVPLALATRSRAWRRWWPTTARADRPAAIAKIKAPVRQHGRRDKGPAPEQVGPLRTRSRRRARPSTSRSPLERATPREPQQPVGGYREPEVATRAARGVLREVPSRALASGRRPSV